MSQTFRRYIPLLISGALGFFIIFVYFFSLPTAVESASDTLIGWGSTVIAISTGLGVIFLLRTHVRKISRREPGEWIYSLVIVVSVFIFPVLSFTHGTTSSLYQTVYQTINGNVGAAVWGILIFALTGAVYKAFRIHSLNASLLLLSCFLVMLQIAPIGGAIWSQFPVIGNWIMDVPTKGGYRGIMIAAAFGLIALGFRTLFGFERGFLGGEEE